MCYRETIRDKLIPQAILWYTGEADQETQYGEIYDDDKEDEVQDIILESDEDNDDEEEDDKIENEDEIDDESEKKVRDKKIIYFF